MASCVEHGEWERKYFACPKCFKDGDVQQPIYPPDRDFVDSLAIKPIDAWTGQEKMRLHNIATRATQSARPEVARSDPGTEKILWNLLDRSYKMMLMAIGPVHEQDPDSNDPIVAWASDVRKVLYGSGRVPSLADLQSLPSPQLEKP